MHFSYWAVKICYGYSFYDYGYSYGRRPLSGEKKFLELKKIDKFQNIRQNLENFFQAIKALDIKYTVFTPSFGIRNLRTQFFNFLNKFFI